MPQLFELQHQLQIQRSALTSSAVEGEETFVVDERSRCSMSTFVEEKLNRLHRQAVQVFTRFESSKN